MQNHSTTLDHPYPASQSFLVAMFVFLPDPSSLRDVELSLVADMLRSCDVVAYPSLSLQK